ncbi:uncharacterized protein LOC106178905 [Lingula anatina]|uniref:Uncharacterized protein LOC106178905 n=1 Tax=Lingula anatina TaxID=7574 RepID=A0A1S3K5L8_LINAN|nr:uncharacterized protein LOC106178905 [Lingula anatina]|eukprot:XP_013417724.1 uncharacterized protein LOC106178905 [Lingula anatina]
MASLITSKKTMRTEEIDKEIQALAHNYTQRFCNFFEDICQEGELVQIYKSSFHGHKERFEEFLNKTEGLLITLQALKFPVLKNGKQVVHFVTPRDELKKGEMYYQIGRTTPGTLSLKFSKAVDESKSQPQVSQVEASDMHRAYTPGYFQELRDFARKHHHPYSDVLFRQCLVWDSDLDQLVPLSTDRLEPKQNLLTKAKAHSVGSEYAQRIKLEIEVKEGRSRSFKETGTARAEKSSNQVSKKSKAGLIRTKGKNVVQPHLPVEESNKPVTGFSQEVSSSDRATTLVSGVTPQEAVEGEGKDSLTLLRHDSQNVALAESGEPVSKTDVQVLQTARKENTEPKELGSLSDQFISVNHTEEKSDLQVQHTDVKRKESGMSVDASQDRDKTLLKSPYSLASTESENFMGESDIEESQDSFNSETVPKMLAYPSSIDAVMSDYDLQMTGFPDQTRFEDQGKAQNRSCPTSKDAVKLSCSSMDYKSIESENLCQNPPYPTSRDAVKTNCSSSNDKSCHNQELPQNSSYPTSKEAVKLSCSSAGDKSRGDQNVAQNNSYPTSKDAVKLSCGTGDNENREDNNFPQNNSYPTSKDALGSNNLAHTAPNPGYPATKAALMTPQVQSRSQNAYPTSKEAV